MLMRLVDAGKFGLVYSTRRAAASSYIGSLHVLPGCLAYTLRFGLQ